MGIKKLGLSFFVLFVFLSLNACVDELTEYPFNPPSNDQGVVAQPPAAEPPQANPTIPDPELIPAPTGPVLGPLVIGDESTEIFRDRVEDLRDRGLLPSSTATPNFPSLSAAGTFRSPIINQLPTVIGRQLRAPGPVETIACDPDQDGVEGIQVTISEQAIQYMAKEYCESFASIEVSDSSSQECHDTVQSCIDTTYSALYFGFDEMSDFGACAHHFGGAPTHPVEDRYCCETSAYNTKIYSVFQNVSMEPKRELIRSTCS